MAVKLNSVIIWLVIGVVAYFLFSCKKESFVDVTKEDKMNLSQQIALFIQSDTEYSAYVDFLKANNYTGIKLFELDTFYELKFLKKSGKLTKDAVYEFIKDE